MCRPIKRVKPVEVPDAPVLKETFQEIPPASFESESDFSAELSDSSSGNERRPKTFVFTTYDMVSDPENAAAIGFSANGNAIEVRDTAVLSEKILPKYFRHKNVTSFYRQLNSYGFRTARSPSDIAHTFVHDTFRQGFPELLASIVRKKYTTTDAAPRVAEKASTLKRQQSKETPPDLMQMIEDLKQSQRAQEDRALLLEARNRQLAEENRAILMEGEYVFRTMHKLVQNQTSAINKLFGPEASLAFAAQIKPGLEEVPSPTELLSVPLKKEETTIEDFAFDIPEDFGDIPSDADLMIPDLDLQDLETLLSFE